MSDDERLSLHSYDPLKDGNDNDEIDEFYKELSLQFYGEEKKKKVSLLMSGSTQETNKPSRDTLPDVKKGFMFVKSTSSRSGSPKCGRNQVQRKSPNQKLQSSPTTIKMIQTKKLIQLLQSPYNMKNKQQQTFLKKQIDMIKKIQVLFQKEFFKFYRFQFIYKYNLIKFCQYKNYRNIIINEVLLILFSLFNILKLYSNFFIKTSYLQFQHMGKAHKTKKFATIKRMITKKDPRCQKRHLEQPKEEKKKGVNDVEIKELTQEPSHLFFRHNPALGPPYRILLDTNFLNFSISNKLDLFKNTMDCLLGKCIPYISDCVIAELEKLGQKTRLALRLSKDPRFEKLTCDHKGTYADDCLVNRVKQHRCFIVATCDKDLKRRIRKIPGVPIMFIQNHKYTIERMPEAFGAPR